MKPLKLSRADMHVGGAVGFAASMLLACFAAGYGWAAESAACRPLAHQPGTPSDALLKVLSAKHVDEQRGLGGTGVIAKAQERGLGGTGIVGVVTGFASVCVNGYEVAINAQTVTAVEEVPARSADLRLGQLVEVEAYPERDKLVAAHVTVRLAVVGPVSAIAPEKTSLRIAGQTVEVAALAHVDGAIRTGDWVAVSGLRRQDGSILGTSLVRLPRHGESVLIAGRVTTAPDGSLDVGGTKISGSGFAPGVWVTLKGQLTGDGLTVQDARIDRSPFSANVRSVSVQADPLLLEAELSRVTGSAVRLSTDALRQATGPGGMVQTEGRVTPGAAFTPDAVHPPGALPETPSMERSKAAPVSPVVPGDRTRDPTGRPAGAPGGGPEGRPAMDRPTAPPILRPDGPRLDRPVRPEMPGPGRR